ncbi:MAG: hypothetical protein ABI120_03225 [Gemmatimonadaceae bacterium]
MRTTQLGRGLLGIGLGVGVIASIAWIAGFSPSKLPPVLLDIAAYKLALIAAVGLMGAGAAVVRSARRSEVQRSRELAAGGMKELAEGDTAPGPQQRVPDEVTNRRV